MKFGHIERYSRQIKPAQVGETRQQKFLPERRAYVIVDLGCSEYFGRRLYPRQIFGLGHKVPHHIYYALACTNQQVPFM